MDTLETLGSTEFAMTRALIRIDSISAAATAPDAIFRFASAVGYINACADIKTISEDAWARLLDLADTAYDAHPLGTGRSDDFSGMSGDGARE